MLRKMLLAGMLPCLSVATALAQAEPAPLVTDRPDVTESALTVAPGMVQLETGLSLTHDTESGSRVRTYTAPPILLRIGLLDRWEARLGFAGWQKIHVRSGPTSASTSGIGDIDLGFKVQLVDEREGVPQVALLAATTLPTGVDGIGSERADPSVLLALSNTLSQRVSLGYNLGVRLTTVTSSDRMERQTDAAYSVSVGVGLAEGVGGFAEAFGTAGLTDSGTNRLSLDGGFTFLLQPNLQLDLSGGAGLTSAADDWFLSAGAAVRVPR